VQSKTQFAELKHSAPSGPLPPSVGIVCLRIEPVGSPRIRPAQPADARELAEMRALLWPESSVEEQLLECKPVLEFGRSGTLPATILIAEAVDGSLAGFLDVGLRSHADGCNPERPVGFIEGWYVREEFRGQGMGRELMHAAEEWAREYQCLEMASDALIDNQESLCAHCALGFEIVDRCAHFRKNL
jgi:aminoglycoside 6'-N-acetyltransferase I